ncbi:CRISPR-associated endonuclease Cas2 [Bifidobacterium canis]|uniref:CRISPR-associated endoribonuclease Cas2 n=1 Tax=Bifidobacterium canis TaxID=2610880 RepID=A0A7K1J567_9BIFI|nr:CRISPR-associated endonuclease Cas2 [Bifidobacterium canis]MUH59794.1 CRISPR-associated protein Cas2 [Bifidobacterium canis]
MKKDEDSGGMWCLVMFDLPVGTKSERHEATVFRNLLLDMGYMMVQFSVYARYTPTQSGNRSTINMIKKHLPSGGKVRVLHISDHQWAQSLRYVNNVPQHNTEAPDVFTLFDYLLPKIVGILTFL